MANTPADCGERVSFPDHGNGFLELALRDKFDIGLCIDLRGTGNLAWRFLVEFLYREGIRYRLRVRPINRFPTRKTYVELIDHLHRTHRLTLSTSGAFCQVDEPLMFPNPDLEVPSFPVYLFYRRISDEGDVWVPSDGDKSRCHGAHRTVVGWEGLVELCHHPPYSRASLHEVNLEPGFGQVQGRLHAANASPHDEHCPNLAVSRLYHRPLSECHPSRLAGPGRSP